MFRHHTVPGPIFELIKTLEFEAELDESNPVRVELFRAIDPPNTYRARVWEIEHYRIQSTFPQDGNSQPAHDPSDEQILIEYSPMTVKGDWDSFAAESDEEALGKFLKAYEAFLDHVAGSSTT